MFTVCEDLESNNSKLYSPSVQDVNVVWTFPDGLLNHGHTIQFTLDSPSQNCCGFSLECSLSICSWQGQGRKPWTGKLSYNENYEHILHLSSPRVSLFCAEVLCNDPSQLHQGNQKSNQTHRGGNRSPSPPQKGMGLESVLCFRRTYGTRSTVCWESKLFPDSVLISFYEVVGWVEGRHGPRLRKTGTVGKRIWNIILIIDDPGIIVKIHLISYVTSSKNNASWIADSLFFFFFFFCQNIVLFLFCHEKKWKCLSSNSMEKC